MGKRYIYNIIISLGTNAITFEPYVTDWEDFEYSGSDYEVGIDIGSLIIQGGLTAALGTVRLNHQA